MTEDSPPRRRTWLRALLVLLCLPVLIAAGAVWTVVTPAGSGPRRVVTVREGQSAWEVTAMLEDMGLVRNATALAAAGYLTGKWRRIQAGRHELDSGMTGMEILDALCRSAQSAWRWLTIPEGYTLWQIAQEVEDKGLAAADDFLNASRHPQAFEVGFPLPNDSLEGYLFPDTYRVQGGEAAEDIVAQMLRRFDQVVWQELFEGGADYGGRRLTEVIILASLVEAEAQREDDRAIIAGVLMNRLERGRRLECDATVQYALGDNRKERLSYEDLQIESEYNTYLHEGLPPGPICNPGEASIRAAMEPAEVPYLYYVARSDGSHIFSRTFAEHQAATARVRRHRR
ncbi:MAG: endolytic transglycosylase MltG [Armatimonadota bacterium]|nr:MAG: endolytic transglycosylase MltG [Armatimonadota bacterium]